MEKQVRKQRGRVNRERRLEGGDSNSKRNNNSAERKKKKGRKQQRQVRILVFVMCGIIAIASIIAFIVGRFQKPVHTSDINDGVNYLQSLENRDITEVVDKISAIKKNRIRESLENGESSVWSQFYDYVVLGDSRAVGFYFYDFLEESRVLAEAGNTIADVPSKIDAVCAINPSNIFLCYGINDVSIGYYPTAEEYAQAMDETVQFIQEKLPNASIYVNSIFPAQDPAFEQAEKWREIPDYNVAVKAMCLEKGYHYIDNSEVFEEHKDLYDIDGIHFQKAFYDYWGANMLAEVLSE